MLENSNMTTRKKSFFAWFIDASKTMKVFFITSLTLNMIAIGGVVGAIADFNNNFQDIAADKQGISHQVYTVFPLASSIMYASKQVMYHIPKDRKNIIKSQSIRSLSHLYSTISTMRPKADVIVDSLAEQLAKPEFSIKDTERIFKKSSRHSQQIMETIDQEIMLMLSMLSNEERNKLSKLIHIESMHKSKPAVEAETNRY